MTRITVRILFSACVVGTLSYAHEYPITTCDMPASCLNIVRIPSAQEKPTNSLIERVVLKLIPKLAKSTGIITLINAPCAFGIDIAQPLMHLLCSLVGYEQPPNHANINLHDTRVRSACMKWHADDFNTFFMRIANTSSPLTPHQEYSIAHCYPFYQFPGFMDFIKTFACYENTICEVYARLLSDKQFIKQLKQLPGMSFHQLLAIVERHYQLLTQ